MVTKPNGSGNAAAMDTPIEAEVLPALGALEQLTRGEIDVQIVTAKRFPRSIETFKKRALSMATLDVETAAACFYVLPRGGKNIEGPSARLAEIVASAWGHMRIEARTVSEDDRFVTARGTAWDLENNVAIAFEVRRRITDKQNHRYNDDMIGVTANAAASIALRNAVFKVVPSAFTREIYHECRRVAVGDAKTLATTRATMLEYFQKMGVMPGRVFALLEVKGIEDITLDHVATLRGLATAIKEGETSVDEAFAEPKANGTTTPADPATVIMSELQCNAAEARAILAGFDALKLPPAQRTVQLKKYQGKTGELLQLLRDMSNQELPVVVETPPATTPASSTSGGGDAAGNPAGAPGNGGAPRVEQAPPQSSQPAKFAAGSRFSF